ncbi:MAG TPA: nitroreductase family deazaflavin-dependent oxidoreductase [Solirubrobacterales bacterium]|nr:nitroreductase family deazaflavin-dependent oxidoreductase [Solirubrobacterales bacterium]
MSYLDLADRTWPLLNRVAGLHTRLYRVSGGRIGETIPGVPGKMCLLDHVGAKSGKKRTAPLLYVRDGDDVVLVASKGGYPKHPAWFHNLKANPETTVQVGGERLAVRARVATAAERKRLWPKAEEAWPGYRTYQARSEGREIPIVILEPR